MKIFLKRYETLHPISDHQCTARWFDFLSKQTRKQSLW